MALIEKSLSPRLVGTALGTTGIARRTGTSHSRRYPVPVSVTCRAARPDTCRVFSGRDFPAGDRDS